MASPLSRDPSVGFTVILPIRMGRMTLAYPTTAVIAAIKA